jgi:hypothetical protein
LKRTVAMERPLLLGADGFGFPEPLGYQGRIGNSSSFRSPERKNELTPMFQL